MEPRFSQKYTFLTDTWLTWSIFPVLCRMSLSQSHLHSASWEAGRTHLAPVVSCCFFTANWNALHEKYTPHMPKTQTQTVCCRILWHSFHADFCPDIGGFSDSFYGFLSCEGLTAVPTRLGPPQLGKNSNGFSQDLVTPFSVADNLYILLPLGWPRKKDAAATVPAATCETQ